MVSHKLRTLIKDEFFIKYLIDIAWFRGEDKDYGITKLMPSLFREIFRESKDNSNSNTYLDANFEFLLIEEGLTNPDILRLFPYIKEKDINIEIYAYFRHIGFPSRLLDFTEDIKVALYFALGDKEENYEGNIEGRIFIFFPRLLNFQVSFLRAIGLIPSKSSNFNLYARLLFATSKHSYLWISNIGWDYDYFDKELEIFQKRFLSESFKNGNNIWKKLKYNLIYLLSSNPYTYPIVLYSTPASIVFLRKHHIFKNQKATAVLFGGYYHDEFTVKSLNAFSIKIECRNLKKSTAKSFQEVLEIDCENIKIDEVLIEDIINQLEKIYKNRDRLDWRWNVLFADSIPFLFEIPIQDLLDTIFKEIQAKPSKKSLKEALTKLGYNEYYIYGLDPKKIPMHVKDFLKF